MSDAVIGYGLAWLMGWGVASVAFAVGWALIKPRFTER